ncbi:Ig-like domain-containing protein [Litorilituus sediminis]|uniref:Big-1 domain-containing protein n=1 Tax=Litorilituus sediminis TaxID=718192 RepID=A0A4P6P776_9GAMM|nr:Ig-like domain-containing protein [Litorilituus sediminis]QBG35275.1 hypothetical protein EMK97_05855 [Litorilituus sediminis]
MQLLRRLSFTMLMMSLMTLVGCGGGDGGDLTGGGGGTDPEPDAIVITLSKSDGDLSGTNDVTITATVTEGDSALANKLVTFTLSDDSLASFTPESGTAVTNASGVATIVVKATTITGGLSVTATVEDVDPVSIGLTSLGGGEGPNELAVSLTISNPEVSAANPSVLTFSIRLNDVPVPDQLITFTIDNTELASFIPSAGTASTDAEGIATISITAASQAGAGLITASIDGNALATTTFNSLGDGNDGGTPNVATLKLLTSSPQLASSDADEITLTVIAKDANNNLIEGVPVVFSANAKASLGNFVDSNGESSNVTNAEGRAFKILTTVGEPENRLITATVASGSISDTVTVQVVGTTVTLTGSSSLAINDENTFIINVLDSDGKPISDTTVSLSLTNESTESPTGDVANITLPESVQTDFTGQARIVVIGTSGGTNTIVASALGAEVTQGVSVQADSFLFTEFGDGSNNVDPTVVEVPDVLLSKTASITLTWLRDGLPVEDGTDVGFTSTRGSLSSSSAKTVDGKVTATITSNNAGKALVTFTGTDSVNGKAIELNNQLEFEFVADNAATLIAQTSPSSIGPNGQTSTVSVVVRDAAGNLVKNKTVDFFLTDVSGGSIFPASAVTDSNGNASTVYTSNNISAKDGVEIIATVKDTPEVTDTAYITVAERELFIALGTGNSIEQVDLTTYNKQYSISVTDINSNPVSGVSLTVSAIPKNYYKGYWVKVLDEGEFDHYAPEYTAICDNEDGLVGLPGAIVNGRIDKGEDWTEDFNGDGNLTPGNIVNVTDQNAGVFTHEFVTDSTGRVLFDIIYAEVFATWANIDLIVTAKVGGTESSANVLFTLPVHSEDITNEDNPPASFIGGHGPFGRADDCRNPN